MTLLLPLLARYGLHIGISVGFIVAFFAWDSSRVNKGRALERAKIEKATDNAVRIGKGAAAKSAAGGLHSNRRDPTTRDD